MNKTRCPWCGKRIDKKKDTTHWNDVFLKPSVPRRLRQANCGHCSRKYGQVPKAPYVLRVGFLILLVLILAFAFQSAFLLLLTPVCCLLLHFMPYSKLNDEGKVCEENSDLLCRILIIDNHDRIKCDELYFLNDRFDDFKPFVLASPIHIYHVPKKGDIVLGDFLYMHEKNYDYMERDSCELYDTEMNLAAKIKFITDIDTTS